MPNRLLLPLFFATLLVACSNPTGQTVELPNPGAPAAIAVPDAFGARVAEDILTEGGNAVDAAVGAAFALAVTYPEAGNIGGGGFMLLYVDGVPEFLDYRETAPAMATRDMYLDEDGDVIQDLSLVGQKAAAVPGTVAGLWAAHQRHGTLPWSEVLAPAVRLAEEGFPVPAQLPERIRKKEAKTFAGRTNFEKYFGGARTGELFRQPELAATLSRIAEHGAAGFYDGETADLIVAEMGRADGLITAEDLADYAPVWREPLAADWRGYQILSAPPPSSGGFAVIALLKMKDHLADAFAGVAHNSPQYIHLVAEMEKRVFADRAEYFGDPDFVEVPIDQLIDDGYIEQRAREVDVEAISTIDSARPGLESHSTTHFSIVDRWGNAVSNTYTLNTGFGSGVVVEGAGFLLNNEMDDFSVKPGVPNFYGVVGNSANAIAPRKRMLSSMSPTILLQDDGSVGMVVGTPGGPTIFTSVFQTVVNILDFDMTPAEAVAAPRFHHQLVPPDLVTYSPGVPMPNSTVIETAELGYRLQPHGWEFGDVQVIWWSGSDYLTGSDPRGRGESRVLH